MQIATCYSLNSNTAQAVAEVTSEIQAQLGNDIDLLIVYYTENHDPKVLNGYLAETLPDTSIHGSTSCLGVMSNKGFHSDEGTGLGVWAVSDPDGSYGTALIPIGNDITASAREVVEKAMFQAGRPGELPDLIWFSSTPGSEETLLTGIQSLVGDSVPIAGGSAADNTVAGGWSLFDARNTVTTGVVVTLFYPSVDLSYAFHSGYSPTETTGVVTRAEGRTIYEIDHQPAAEVYNNWIGKPFTESEIKDGGNILAKTTLSPLGRHVGASTSVEQFKLSHPDSITPSGGLTLFSDIQEGDQLVLMTGSVESLTSRAGRVTSAAMAMGDFENNDISGVLVIYCAGCMLTVQDSMSDVVDSVNAVLNDTPYLGAFTFGEQGCFVDAGNEHGNLMISSVVFGK